jgi:kynurenine 3-monooxygenase
MGPLFNRNLAPRERPERTHDIVVVGAGISGPVMALHLAAAGHNVLLLEQGPAPDSAAAARTSSFNITLCERGLAALESVVPRAAIHELCVPLEQRVIHNAGGSTTLQPYSAFGDTLFCVSRNDLRQLLVQYAAEHPAISISYNQQISWYDVERGVLDVLDTEHGEERSLAPRHLFAADGARSVVRQCMLSSRRFNYSQQYATQGHLELRIAKQHAPASWKQHVGLHIWPRGDFMFLAFPNLDGSYTGTLHLPLEGENSFADLNQGGGIKAHFEQHYPDLLAMIPDLEEQYRQRTVVAMLMVKCSPWNIRDEVVLVGDAAHSVWPSYGQGANATFESCELLGRALKGVAREDWADAMTSYAAARRIDTDALSDLCVEHWKELRGHVADNQFLLKKALERELSLATGGQFRSLYELISFSRTPYAVARARAREQDLTLSRLLALPNAKQLIEAGDIAGLLACAHGWAASEPTLSELSERA